MCVFVYVYANDEDRETVAVRFLPINKQDASVDDNALARRVVGNGWTVYIMWLKNNICTFLNTG